MALTRLQKLFLERYEANFGHPATVLKEINVSQKSYSNWLKKKEFVVELQKIKEKENPLYSFGDLTANQVKFLEAYRQTLGVVSPACRAANLAYATVHNWRKNDPKFVEAMEAVLVGVVDVLEHKYLQLGLEGNPHVLKHLLAVKAKDRGYGDKPLVSNTINFANMSLEELDDVIKSLESELES